MKRARRTVPPRLVAIVKAMRICGIHAKTIANKLDLSWPSVANGYYEKLPGEPAADWIAQYEALFEEGRQIAAMKTDRMAVRLFAREQGAFTIQMLSEAVKIPTARAMKLVSELKESGLLIIAGRVGKVRQYKWKEFRDG